MKLSVIILLLFSCSVIAQARYDKTKISQSTQPDCSISSNTITTKIYAQLTGTGIWEKVWETEIAVSKIRYAKKVRQEEYKKAVAEAQKLVQKLNADAARAEAPAETPATFDAR